MSIASDFASAMVIPAALMTLGVAIVLLRVARTERRIRLERDQEARLLALRAETDALRISRELDVLPVGVDERVFAREYTRWLATLPTTETAR